MLCLRLLRIICLVATVSLPHASSEDASAEDLALSPAEGNALSEEEVELSITDKALLVAHQLQDTEKADGIVRFSGSDLTPDGHQTALMTSVLSGSAKMVAWSLRNGADGTLAWRDAGTPMMVAAHEGVLAVLPVLKEHGVIPEAKAAVQACRGAEEKHTQTVAWFLNNGVSLDGTSVYEACMKVTPNLDTIELLENLKIEFEEEL